MSVVNMFLLTCLLLCLFLYIRVTQKLRRFICGPEDTNSVGLEVQYIIFATLPILAMCAVHVPLPAFYLLFYGMSCLSEIVTRRGHRPECVLINVRFLIFAAPHLIVVGILALCVGAGVTDVFDSFTLRVLSLIIVIMLNVVLLSILAYRSKNSRLRGIQWVSEESQLFSRFIWFCAGSVFFDSIPCLFSLSTIFPLVFLIGSNLLLLLMAFLFAHHVYTIMRDSYLKEESMRLWEEAMAQHIRTAQLEKEAYLDVLTKIYNRQYALSNMSSMLRSGEAFTLIFLDLDKLKQINDRQGHLAGDEYLKAFSARMKERLRPNDVFARYGGDEFLVLMPDLSQLTADAQMRHIQADASMASPAGWGIPFSYGLAVVQPDAGRSAEEWISMADQAMYLDKKRRRVNREGDE